jgi:hypothetical protein
LETRASFVFPTAPQSALIRLDLPTFDRPENLFTIRQDGIPRPQLFPTFVTRSRGTKDQDTYAISGTPSVGHCTRAAAPRRNVTFLKRDAAWRDFDIGHKTHGQAHSSQHSYPPSRSQGTLSIAATSWSPGRVSVVSARPLRSRLAQSDKGLQSPDSLSHQPGGRRCVGRARVLTA